MSLFVNVLVHPRSAQAQNDLTALAVAAGTIQSIPLNRPHETERVKELGNFIMELVRLGNCAIWKAKKSASARGG